MGILTQQIQQSTLGINIEQILQVYKDTTSIKRVNK